MPLTAKYATTCPGCGRSVEPGAPIGRIGSRWGHQDCADAPDGLIPLADIDPAVAAAADQPSPPAAPRARSAATGSTRARRPRPADMPAATDALEVWTDGACSGNPGPGGWAWATKDGRQANGGAKPTTNQRMEIQAALEAVTALDGPLTVVSDSTYVVNCFRDGWWKGWLARDWQTSAKKPVANRDLWEPLITAVNDRRDVSFRWVKGHSGDEMNDLVDRLAVAAAKDVA